MFTDTKCVGCEKSLQTDTDHDLERRPFGVKLRQLSVNCHYYFSTQGKLEPFINGGVGAYDLNPGSTEHGLNLGAGFKLPDQTQAVARRRNQLSQSGRCEH